MAASDFIANLRDGTSASDEEINSGIIEKYGDYPYIKEILSGIKYDFYDSYDAHELLKMCRTFNALNLPYTDLINHIIYKLFNVEFNKIFEKHNAKFYRLSEYICNENNDFCMMITAMYTKRIYYINIEIDEREEDIRENYADIFELCENNLLKLKKILRRNIKPSIKLEFILKYKLYNITFENKNIVDYMVEVKCINEDIINLINPDLYVETTRMFIRHYCYDLYADHVIGIIKKANKNSQIKIILKILDHDCISLNIGGLDAHNVIFTKLLNDETMFTNIKEFNVQCRLLQINFDFDCECETFETKYFDELNKLLA